MLCGWVSSSRTLRVGGSWDRSVLGVRLGGVSKLKICTGRVYTDPMNKRGRSGCLKLGNIVFWGEGERVGNDTSQPAIAFWFLLYVQYEEMTNRAI